MLELRMFKARDGDCLLLSHVASSRRMNILVDGGRGATYAVIRPVLEGLARAGERIDLLVLTHVDGDHIGGLMPLIMDAARPIDIGEIWCNGFEQLSRLRSSRSMGFGQAEDFLAALKRNGLSVNARFGGDPVVLPDDGMPFRVPLGDELSVTVLSPDVPRLHALAVHWKAWRDERAHQGGKPKPARRGRAQAMGRRPMPDDLDVEELAACQTRLDDDPVNGSSIAFVAEADGARVLLCADANADLLATSLARLRTSPGAYPIDLVKVPHHGSRFNTTVALVEAFDCRRFAISTDGSHGHPDPETIAKLIRYARPGGTSLMFNHRQERTSPWDALRLRRKWGYEVRFAEEGSDFLTIPVQA